MKKHNQPIVNPYRVPGSNLETESKGSREWSNLDTKNARKYFRWTYIGGISSGYSYLMLVSAFDLLHSGTAETFFDPFFFFIGYLVALSCMIPCALVYVDRQKKKYSVRGFIAKSQKELASWYSNPLVVSVGLAMFVSFLIIFDLWYENPTKFHPIRISEKKWTSLAVFLVLPIAYWIFKFFCDKAKKLIDQISLDNLNE